MIRRPPRSTRKESSAASDVYKRQPFTIFVTNELKKDGKLKIKYQINDKDIEANTNGSKYTFKVTGTMPGTSDEVYSKDCSLPDIYGRYELELDNLPIGDYQVVADNPGGEFDSATYYKDSDGMNDGCLLYTSPSPRDRQKSRMPSSA